MHKHSKRVCTYTVFKKIIIQLVEYITPQKECLSG